MEERWPEGVSPESLERLCGWISTQFGNEAVLPRRHGRQALTVLCQVATTGDERIQRIGQEAIFGSLVERLNDSFDPAQVRLFDEAFAHIIDFCRRQPHGSMLDQTLERFGIRNNEDLLSRKARVAAPRTFPSPLRSSVRKALVFSRVTLGADVAVTSVIVRHLLNALPNADILLVGPAAIKEVYAEGSRLGVVEVPYQRQGSLWSRLASWVDLVRAVDRECRTLSRDDYIIVDPDSRFTQLGLLPVTANEERYFFFESRTYQRSGKTSLGHLAAEWSAEVFGGGAEAYPFVRLSRADADLGKRCLSELRGGTSGKVVSVNLGVGNNERKRVSLQFEKRLIFEMLSRGYRVILDKGIGNEVHRINQIVEELSAAGKRVTELASDETGLAKTDVLTWEGRAGVFAGLVAETDLYVGYDSGFQHIAAALGVPVVDVFVDQGNDTFIDRWTPHSHKPVKVVKVDVQGATNFDGVIGQVLSAVS